MKLEREYTRFYCNFKGEILCLLSKVPQLHSISGFFFLGPSVEMFMLTKVVGIVSV